MRILQAAPADVPSRFGGLDARRVAKALVFDDGSGGIALGREPFDSEIFQLEIGRILSAHATSRAAHRTLLNAMVREARDMGFDQIIRRVLVGNMAEIWALEGAGFDLMDVGLTFARILRGPLEAPSNEDLVVRPSTDADMARIIPIMVDRPWGSRYEADPAYPSERVKDLRSRWLWNSHRGRAAVVHVGEIDGEPAGYVTCLVDATARVGEIELVGTLPAFRGRRVASRILDHAVAWFSTRVDLVTVRTQATNFPAATLYEKTGFVLHASDMTLRLALSNSGKEAP